MVIHTPIPPPQRRGSILVEALVAMMLVLVALVPIGKSIGVEKRLARAHYEHAVAMEIVDGEMEALMAGEWRSLPPGTSAYQVHAASLTNLPPGRFLVTLETNRLRLVWQPATKDHGGPVTREAIVK